MSIHVTDFKWEKGNNDLQYIELLEKTLKNEQAITAKAVAKIRELSVKNSELHNEAQAERAFLTERDAEIREKAIDEAIEASAKAICVGCGYLDGYKCTYKGSNCGVSKPMLESVTKALEQMKGGAVDG